MATNRSQTGTMKKNGISLQVSHESNPLSLRNSSALVLEYPSRYGLLIFKDRLVEAGLANDALESTAPEGIMEWDGDGNGCPVPLQLHDSVAAALAHSDKSVPFENLASFGA